jgi:DNA-directed RNA polymerase specialized sigma subunit
VKDRLSESEERELIRRAKAGDDGARNRLWEAFFPFAVAECRKQAELTNLDADIAEGEAALAIPEAIIRFDLRRHNRFSTYLAYRLRGAITAASREHPAGRGPQCRLSHPGASSMCQRAMCLSRIFPRR